jgi:hypothetical protein
MFPAAAWLSQGGTRLPEERPTGMAARERFSQLTFGERKESCALGWSSGVAH